MKKAIYILFFAIITSMSISACTEEEVAPTELSKNGGGGESEPR